MKTVHVIVSVLQLHMHIHTYIHIHMGCFNKQGCMNYEGTVQQFVEPPTCIRLYWSRAQQRLLTLSQPLKLRVVTDKTDVTAAWGEDCLNCL